ncbi:hypothetical protein [Halorarum halobium]|uniref:hypothetical protein n=1 Tax=Halorarum halobium TaxID=3075121 RepID=UPI0028ABD205|nr:hypothetical protein [Halobaculum sp. XH14]
MAREVRITVDDDEVFERMKRRKRELDLSWEEVLYRGLTRREAGGQSPPNDSPGERAGGPVGEPGPAGPRDGEHREERGDRWDRFASGLEREIQNKVYDTLASSFGSAGIDVPPRPDAADAPGGLDDEVESLASAEDATLAFPFLDDEGSATVPLRVALETGPDGLSIEVVALRRGKGVAEANSFDAGDRQRVNTRLAAGDAAVLSFADGAESYRVRPVLSWTRGEDGRPTVDEVDVPEVVLDADE